MTMTSSNNAQVDECCYPAHSRRVRSSPGSTIEVAVERHGLLHRSAVRDRHQVFPAGVTRPRVQGVLECGEIILPFASILFPLAS
jgi:hypothetical protein